MNRILLILLCLIWIPGRGQNFFFNQHAGVLASAPTVTTTTVSSIGPYTASSGGNVTSDGGATVTARGVCWSTSSNPTTSNSKTTDGSGTGSYTSSITGLTCGYQYYVRAYATNSEGTSYGTEYSFTTTTSGLSSLHFIYEVNSSCSPYYVLITSETTAATAVNLLTGAGCNSNGTGDFYKVSSLSIGGQLFSNSVDCATASISGWRVVYSGGIYYKVNFSNGVIQSVD